MLHLIPGVGPHGWGLCLHLSSRGMTAESVCLAPVATQGVHSFGGQQAALTTSHATSITGSAPAPAKLRAST